MVRRLALVSTPFSQDGFFPEMLPQQAAVSAAMAEQLKETPMYLAILPNLTHYEIGLAPELVDTALPFLDGHGRARSWASR